jgi:hypothetical protein
MATTPAADQEAAQPPRGPGGDFAGFEVALCALPRGADAKDQDAVDSPRSRIVAEVLIQFTDPVSDEEGLLYAARACGAEMAADLRWQGWIEFLPIDVDGRAATDGRLPVRSGRETTQPNRQDTEYWASGLTAVYLEGALRRALNPLRRPPEPLIPPPVFDAPAANSVLEPLPEGVLNPFSVYRNGELQLRNQLAALSSWHLANIIRAYGLSDLDAGSLEAMPASALIEIIVAGVRQPRPLAAK